MNASESERYIESLLGSDGMRPEDRAILMAIESRSLPTTCPVDGCKTTYDVALVMGRHLMRQHDWTAKQIAEVCR